MMLTKIAWRNIWRNKRRSVIVIISVAVGVLATILVDMLSRGMMVQMLNHQIGSHVAHIQIHRRGFRDNPVIQSYLPDPIRAERAVEGTPGVQAWAPRVLTFGLLSSASSSSGVSLVGIEPDREEMVTEIKTSLVEGRYLTGEPGEIVLGKRLAEKLGVEIGDKVVAMASAVDNRVGSDVFRIVGIYQTFGSQFDLAYVYIPMAAAQAMLGLGRDISEIALLIHNLKQLQAVQGSLALELGEAYEVLTYPEILPLLVLQLDLFVESMAVFYAIIGIALIFGIINTMLMAVLERIREFGILKSIGMKDRRIFAMILLEAGSLGVLGTTIGFALGYVAFLLLSRTGLDLRMFSEALTAIGAGTVIYPILTVDGVLSALLIIPFVALLGAIYPAVRAVRLKPVEALRYV